MVKGLSNDHGALIAAAAMDAPFASIDDVWRRSGVPAAALEKLADADAFRASGSTGARRLWRVRGLGGAPLPLFAAAEARGQEPEVALTPMTEGREVVEDYRAVQLSLRAHPLAFLRPALDRRRHPPLRRAAATSRTGRRSMSPASSWSASGPAPATSPSSRWRTRPASPMRSSGSASSRRTAGSSWPPRWSASRGTLQREGQVIHLVTDRLEDLTPLLHQVGAMHFPHRPGPADAARMAATTRATPRRPALPAPRDGGLRIRSRNFH